MQLLHGDFLLDSDSFSDHFCFVRDGEVRILEEGLVMSLGLLYIDISSLSFL